MGGHQSKQTVATATNVAANIMQRTIQDCVNSTAGSNTLAVSGTGNTVSGTDQAVSISFNANCQSLSQQKTDFEAKLKATAAQALKDQEQALTQWMDTSGDTQATVMTQSVVDNFTQRNVQHCGNSLNASNVISVSGTDNTVKGAVQSTVLSVLGGCIQAGGQTSKVVTNITDAANQAGDYKSKSPLGWIGDIFEGPLKSLVVVAAVVFVVIVCLVFLYVILRHRRRGGAAPPAPAPPRAAGLAPAEPGKGLAPAAPLATAQKAPGALLAPPAAAQKAPGAPPAPAAAAPQKAPGPPPPPLPNLKAAA